MAQFIGNARTNYFTVKNRENFETDLMYIHGIEVAENTEGQVCLLVSDGDSGCWPAWIERDMLLDDMDDDQKLPAWIMDAPADEIEIDLPAIVSKHLTDGEVAIFMENGAEKLRYLTGYAHAINNKGETRTINLTDIYDLASELTTKKVTVAEY